MVLLNMEKAKAIAHKTRRAFRNREMEPYDEVITKQIPNTDLAAVEQQRQTIRNKYAGIQTNIDEATTEQELLTILKNLG